MDALILEFQSIFAHLFIRSEKSLREFLKCILPCLKLPSRYVDRQLLIRYMVYREILCLQRIPLSPCYFCSSPFMSQPTANDSMWLLIITLFFFFLIIMYYSSANGCYSTAIDHLPWSRKLLLYRCLSRRLDECSISQSDLTTSSLVFPLRRDTFFYATMKSQQKLKKARGYFSLFDSHTENRILIPSSFPLSTEWDPSIRVEFQLNFNGISWGSFECRDYSRWRRVDRVGQEGVWRRGWGGGMGGKGSTRELR